MNETGDTMLAQSLNRFAAPDVAEYRRCSCRLTGTGTVDRVRDRRPGPVAAV
jgi:hypothetical protein